MCKNFLPEYINAFLDDVETTMCLPILVIIVVCTLQFIFNHVADVGCVVYETVQDKLDNKEFGYGTQTNLINRLKEIITNLIFKHSTKIPSTPKINSNLVYKRNNKKNHLDC
ncbi:uncharacterized protein LOC122522255 [Polistes fuscatus]|uniref:uncharacterized protein LOC122522255 n=1 Tax=Polistes fuscatus TaxID=30207 RepID=UPI001CAA381C|nr:uncharacterized protein LOC122522255 [Polistes fuscatus]